MLLEPQRVKNTIRCAAPGLEVPGHCQEQLLQTLIVHILKLHFWHSALIVKRQQNRDELVSRPVWHYRNVLTSYEYDSLLDYTPSLNHMLLITGSDKKQSKIIVQTCQVSSIRGVGYLYNNCRSVFFDMVFLAPFHNDLQLNDTRDKFICWRKWNLFFIFLDHL